MQSESIKEITKALAIFQREVTNASKDKTNPHFRNKYATLESYLNEINPKLSECGLAITQGLVDKDILETKLLHVSGEMLRFSCPLYLDKQNMQGLGSAITYARRYALAAILGMGAEDDDAEASVDHSKHQKQPVRVPATKPQENFDNHVKNQVKAIEKSVETIKMPTPPVFNDPMPTAADAPPEVSEDEKHEDDLSFYGNFYIKVGKHKDKYVKDLGPIAAIGYSKYMKKESEGSGKALTGHMAELITAIDRYYKNDIDFNLN